ncbi:Cytochrome c1, heme protein, mitochondrial [Neolecta irregularis DAH-3]|uniref:quinol--cytochrome-c reductase n=1 Tax=Neolecta irregularis (strain DAH-3) TaxID=1198029 RepID=A0A1U7LPW3_NEOID|nr:Cytochrome c1, heme protein, mitochondrial [Neolecta irregularis DAH-3]|eukprot:OLL24684.1 Cytochrome c1, heme protein, mitochondrial [Neolecta irregularis DAH-3]
MSLLPRLLKPAYFRPFIQKCYTSSSSSSASTTDSRKWVTFATCASVSSVLGLGLYYQAYANPISATTAAEEGLHPTHYPWPQNSPLSGFDHKSLRRGFKVYQEACASCHSLSRIAWRNLVGVTHTVDETKALAEQVEYDDGPDDKGEMFKRPGKLSDYLPSPFPNEQAARAGNGGALPPDLSLIVKARHGGCDYIFSILTGYVDPPVGVKLGDGLNFNLYFPGTGIAMPRILFDGLVEYEDGTPATTSQMAYDVTNFLNWAAEPCLEDSKRKGLKAVVGFAVLFGISIWLKRFKWIPLKTRKIVYNPPKI